MRHGLTAETVIATLEDAEDYQAFEAAVIADYDAESAVERELVLRLASVLWRLRRATGIETALFESVSATSDKSATDQSKPILIAGLNCLQPGAVRSPDRDADVDVRTEIGDRFLRLANLPTFPFDRLSRYEYMLWRQARQLALTLEWLRRRKRSRSSFPFSFRRHDP